ncbi:aminotransferase class V-fold PLP-dependent enzyme [Paracoccus aminophilus]|uniref:Aminotransferase class V n=1 Tax=Paracoccus aminophilus JCM 7686 TaxID=1367847 RepID=S5YD62_PARAH|nr:aminotransferase class V-fold PLP-dependent enzyme [Paracoccus aminophilus]AGT09398.1 aminotransferase class V [Paracoccus aminophilus JCM 7686]
MPDWSPLPDAPLFPPEGYAPLADAIAGLLGTKNDVLLVQGEAVVALEAAASSLGRPGLRALNIVTSLYGRWFGGWLRRAGAEVVDLTAPPGLPIGLEAVEAALAQGKFDLVAVVHAESATGILNPLAGILALAQATGALTVVDVVASLGGHAVEVDDLGIDIAVMGPQKSLGGQAGVSALSVSPRAWAAVHPGGEAPSILSLADQKTLWLDQGRHALPGTPSALEFHALAAALDRVRAEGLSAIERRHARAANAARAGVLALVGRNWVAEDQASNLVTPLPVPDSMSADDLLAELPEGHALSAGVGPAGDRLLRLNHTGPRAALEPVLSDLNAIAHGLHRLGVPADPGQALGAAAEAFG